MAREKIPAERGLTLKQAKFVDFFIGIANGNGTEAARLAGYASPRVQASQNLTNPNIRAAIDAIFQGHAMSAAEVVARLADMARADVADFDGLVDFVEVERRGKTTHKMTIDLKGARERGKSRLIKKLTPTGDGVTIELHDAQAALDKLAKIHGLYKAESRSAEQAKETIGTLREHLDGGSQGEGS